MLSSKLWYKPAAQLARTSRNCSDSEEASLGGAISVGPLVYRARANKRGKRTSEETSDTHWPRGTYHPDLTPASFKAGVPLYVLKGQYPGT